MSIKQNFYETKAHDVCIRSWCKDDDQQLFDVLKDGSYSNVMSWCKIKLKDKITILSICTLSLVSYTCFGTFNSFVLSVLVSVLFVCLFVFVATLYYIYGPPLHDMKDVKNTYFSSEDTHFWVADLCGKIIGTIAIIQFDKMTGCQSEKVAWLRRLVVHKQFRGLGIARKLVAQAKSFCKEKGYSRINLVTTEVHLPARKLYESMGFVLQNYSCKYLNGWVPVWTYDYVFHLNKLRTE